MFEVLKDYCQPVRGTKYSAYVDLFSADDYTIGAGCTSIVKLGVKLDIEKLKEMILKNPIDFTGFDGRFTNLLSDDTIIQRALKSHYLEVALRSSLGVKGLIIANGIGVIDLDYPDEIGLIVHNPISNITKHDYKDRIVKLCGQSKQHPFGHFEIKKGDKVAQCTLKEHKGFMMGYESDVVRISGYGSTGK